MDEWGKCLRKIQHAGYNRFYRHQDKWFRKLSTICNTWRKYYYQMEGSRQKTPSVIKKCNTWEECFRRCLKKWNDNRRHDAWAKTLENIRTNWRDRSKRIKGRCVNGKR